MTGRAIPTRPGALHQMVRNIRLAWLRWCIACLRDERDRYTRLGWAGPIYQRESRQQELELYARIRRLEHGHVAR